METLKLIHVLFLFIILSSCNVSPQAINYGKEACSYCKMTIVDRQHAAEIVTKKGKVYKFDASECMVHFMEDYDISTIQLFLSNNYSKPETLIDATKATFLISENIPSPMGAYLSAFKNKGGAIKVQEKKGGTLYSWEELLNYFN